MKQVVLLLIATMLFISCSTNRYKSELDFGNKLSSEGLWKEAEYWWKRSIKKDGETAANLNNMGVFYEQKHQLQKALKSYNKALKLSPGNKYITLNIERIKKRIKNQVAGPEMEMEKKNEK